MELREMIPAEQKYTYRQSHQLDAQTGCIGYLRGDFGSTGKEFYSSWFDNMAYLKSPEFQAQPVRRLPPIHHAEVCAG